MNLQHIKKPSKKAVDWDKIKLLAFDCDGVLTQGGIIYGNEGQELKDFDARDGMGFMLLKYTDIQVAIITGRQSEALARRSADLKIAHLYQQIPNKLQVAKELLDKLGLSFDNMLFMGDDWNDFPLMSAAAVSVCPHDAAEEITTLVDHVTKASGGRGAVRECIEMVLKQRGIFEQAINAYLDKIS